MSGHRRRKNQGLAQNSSLSIMRVKPRQLHISLRISIYSRDPKPLLIMVFLPHLNLLYMYMEM